MREASYAYHVFWTCFLPTIYQGVLISLPLLSTGLLVRLCARTRLVGHLPLSTLSTTLGMYVLWQFYGSSVAYFILLSVLVYVLLLVVGRFRGAAVGTVCVAFIVICELFVTAATDWHRIRGSFLVMVMKMVSLAFDLEPQRTRDGEERTPAVGRLPDFLDYSCYCLFPGTTLFGPFVTYQEHWKFMTPTPLTLSWVVNVVRSLLSSLLSLGLCVCVFPFLFNEPLWNKCTVTIACTYEENFQPLNVSSSDSAVWLAAYSAAASFRYSHYFVSFLSESAILASGIGYQPRNDGTQDWSAFRVVHPVAVELPRSLGTVVTNWNLPMHLFLKNYVFKPSRAHLGRFGAILLTYIASAMLHGLNFQLAAVLLSIGIYAYIESVLRYKLSRRFSACIQDRPCPRDCEHKAKTVWWVRLVNMGFTLLSLFHLAYLGLMFGGPSQDERLEIQGYSMMHTLRKWAHLNFLSHWIALLTYVVASLL